MEIISDTDIENAVNRIKNGDVIAYPTEAVFGLGCDPYNINAVSRLLQIKHRALDKGFILIAANWEQIEPLINYIQPDLLIPVFETWPGPTTWLFPASDQVPHWIKGNHQSVAVRITAHPVAKALCEYFGGPIISTSCNKSGDPPARDVRTIQLTLSDTVDCIVTGEPGCRLKPTKILDVLTGETIRA